MLAGHPHNESHPYVPILMEEAFKEARTALHEGEVPVGCVFVHTALNRKLAELGHFNTADDAPVPEEVQATLRLACSEPGQIFHGRNATNRLRHALAHAEFVALDALTAHIRHAPLPCARGRSVTAEPLAAASSSPRSVSPLPTAEVGEGGSTPLSQFVLYVTVEPCIMCASMLLYNSVGHVYFGAGNPRFGGNGTVLALHEPVANDLSTFAPSAEGGEAAGADVRGEVAEQRGAVCGYSSVGGHRAEDAITLLQWFYERENPNAPGHKRRRKLAEDGPI